jgi:hypothetical protein
MPTLHRPLATLAIMVLLPAGFAYSSVATLRQYRDLFRQPATTGPSATIDAYLRPIELSSGEELRLGVRRVWRSNEHIVLLADASAFSRDDIQQVYYATAYLLYPRPISLARWCDPHAGGCHDANLPSSPKEAAGDTRRAILIGAASSTGTASSFIAGYRARGLSRRVTLVEFR